MNHKQLLIDREYNLNDGRVSWYASLYKLREFKSVVLANFFETCSSAGDWTGYLVQHIGNMNYMIIFWQENNYPYNGYTVYTSDYVKATWKGDFDRETAEAILADILQEE